MVLINLLLGFKYYYQCIVFYDNIIQLKQEPNFEIELLHELYLMFYKNENKNAN